MKTIMVFGAGKMGVPTALFLQELGYNVVVVDSVLTTYAEETLGRKDILLLDIGHSKDYDYLISLHAPHMVVSCLPYHANLLVAKAAVKAGVDYFDLGGKVENTEKIKELAEGKKDVAVFTDLGLAPGLINIFTQYELKQFDNTEVDNITAYVGGIPTQDADAPFNYHCTWSVDGLLNEYIDNAVVVENGKQATVPGMSDYDIVKCHTLNKDLEAFVTSGASSHSIDFILRNGYQNFQYKTLRYPGHLRCIEGLHTIFGSTFFRSVVERLSTTAPVKDDIVICKLVLEKDKRVVLDREFSINNFNGMTAMQRATAGPLAVVAHLRLAGYLPSGILTYDHVVPHWAYMKCKLKEVGISL
jgi:saccharopine dehydrogenase-like NADP-dependent oxidoreductase